MAEVEAMEEVLELLAAAVVVPAVVVEVTKVVLEVLEEDLFHLEEMEQRL